MTDWRAIIGLTCLLTASCSLGEEKADPVCKTCNDTGIAQIECPVCQGSKYVWQCKEKSKSWSSFDSFRYDENGERISSSDGWCGYGSTYKAIHKNCKNSRKRLACPKCLNKGKTAGTGKITTECPNCDGHGHLAKTYYLLRDVRDLDFNRDYILRQFERGREVPYVQCRKLSTEELSDYKIENPRCKVFSSREALGDFIKNGEEKGTDAKWYFAIRDAKRITMYDKRRALEGTFGSYDYGYDNVLKRKFSSDELKDFKALNPNCQLFRDIEAFKDFVRNVKPVAEGTFERSVVVGEPSEGGFRRVLIRTNSNGRVYRTLITGSGIGSGMQRPTPREPSPEEVKKMVETELEYDKKMRQKKFGQE